MTPAQLQAYVLYLHTQVPPGTLGDAFYNGGLAPSGFGVVQYVANVAAVSAISPLPANGTPVMVLGTAAAPGDTEVGMYVLNTASSATVDGGSVLATSTGSGRWLKIL